MKRPSPRATSLNPGKKHKIVCLGWRREGPQRFRWPRLHMSEKLYSSGTPPGVVMGRPLGDTSVFAMLELS